MEWISTKDRPLIEPEAVGGWIATVDGDKEFIAAVPYIYDDASLNSPVEKWWIRHCVLEDGTGLCVVGDDDNEPAGWQIEEVTHWMPLPEPPKE